MRTICMIISALVLVACGQPQQKSHLDLTTTFGVLLWEDGIIPYSIEGFTRIRAQHITDAAAEISNRTNVSFIPVVEVTATTLRILPAKTGCRASTIGRGYTNPTISLSSSCKKASIMHEMLHILGFAHEHVYPKAVQVRDHLVQSDIQLKYNFLDPSAREVTDYDAESIMHYSSQANSICDNLDDEKWDTLDEGSKPKPSCQVFNWREIPQCPKQCATILSAEGELIESQRTGLSKKDIEGINRVYPK